ncbi:hypothetical protein SUGI_0026710 [Cryptomeria japonica]|nr:hypothetical protein SUGI_0026710 [Cryptomeria japonica]
MALVRANDEHETPLISDDWIVEVEKILRASDGDGGIVTRWVPEVLAKGKPEAYAPQILSLRPCHYRALKDNSMEPHHHGLSHISQMELYKLKCTKDAAHNNLQHIDKVFNTMDEPNIKSILEQFYNWKVEMRDGNGHGSRKFRWMMTVDAFFLYQFLDSPNEFCHPLARETIKCDILKLEN